MKRSPLRQAAIVVLALVTQDSSGGQTRWMIQITDAQTGSVVAALHYDNGVAADADLQTITTDLDALSLDDFRARYGIG